MFTRIIDNRSVLLKISPLIGTGVLLITLLMGTGVTLFNLIVLLLLVLGELLLNFRKQKTPIPYLLMFLSPLVLVHYSSVSNFQMRIVFFVFLIFVFSFPFRKSTDKNLISSINHGNSKTIFLISFLIFVICACLITSKGVTLSGDEPHYLIVSQSLLEDADFNLQNNMEEKSYKIFYTGDLDLHGGVYNRKTLSYHLPGLSILLIPFLFLFKLFPTLIAAPLYFRLAGALFGALLALSVFKILKIYFPEKNVSGVWLLFVSSVPLIFHGVHLYPEIIVAVIFLWGFITGVFYQKYFISGLLLSLIPWFHIKYFPFLIILAIFLLWRLVKEKKWRVILNFLLFPVLSFILLLYYTRSLYGFFNPADILRVGDHFIVSLLPRLETFFAYFIDQRDGLLIYGPLFFLVFLSLKSRIREYKLLNSMFFIYLLFSALTTSRGGYSPLGRVFIAVIWIAYLFIADFWLSYRRKQGGAILILFGGLSLLMVFMILYINPLFIYQEIDLNSTSRFQGIVEFFSSDYLSLKTLLPSFQKTSNLGYIQNYIWILILLLLIFLIYRKGIGSLKFQKWFFTVLFIILFFSLCFFPNIKLREDRKNIDKKISFYNNSGNFIQREDGKTYRVKTGGNYDIYIDLKNYQQQKIKFNFLNIENTDLKIRNNRALLFKSDGKKRRQFSVDLSKLKRIKVKKKIVAHLGFELIKKGDSPFLFFRLE